MESIYDLKIIKGVVTKVMKSMLRNINIKYDGYMSSTLKSCNVKSNVDKDECNIELNIELLFTGAGKPGMSEKIKEYVEDIHKIRQLIKILQYDVGGSCYLDLEIKFDMP